MSVIRGDEVGYIDRETMQWHRDHDATIKRMRARLGELGEIIEANVPLPWCPECKTECSRVDEDGCCLGCGVDVVCPTSEHVARVAALERELFGVKANLLAVNRIHAETCAAQLKEGESDA